MARRKNIFDFASKELSATAFWAWVLDGEHSDDAALKAVNADLRARLDIPANATLASIELEKNPDDPGLKPLAEMTSDKDSGRKRIDILAIYRKTDGDLLHVVIENKVRRDVNVIAQVTGYRDRLQKRVAGLVQAAVFTFDNSLALSKSAAEGSITVFTLAEMVSMIDKHAESNAIIQAYLCFLQDKLTIANASPARSPGNSYPENQMRWSVVAAQIGIQPLLDEYSASAEKYGFSITSSKGRSIFLTLGNKRPVVSVHPSKSSAVHGLWLGVSITNLSRIHGAPFSRDALPANFAWQLERQSGNEWRFGYVDIDCIDPILQMIAQSTEN